MRWDGGYQSCMSFNANNNKLIPRFSGTVVSKGQQLGPSAQLTPFPRPLANRPLIEHRGPKVDPHAGPPRAPKSFPNGQKSKKVCFDTWGVHWSFSRQAATITIHPVSLGTDQLWSSIFPGRTHRTTLYSWT